MKVLMFGWEFPPHISGGLGTACFGLTKGLAVHDVDVLFVVPKAYGDESQEAVKIIGAGDIRVQTKRLSYKEIWKDITYIEVGSALVPYLSPEEYENFIKEKELKGKEYTETNNFGHFEFSGKYGPNLMQEVSNYAAVASIIASNNEFDVIHAHDWLTYAAGVAAKRASGKPLVVHVHATEFDRTGENVNTIVYDIEKMGMENADYVITVSNLTRNIVIEKYGIPANKVITVYNAVEPTENKELLEFKKGVKEKIVTFLGRITFQKGPEYFVEAAHRVLQRYNDVRFVMAGSGDMMNKVVRRAAELGIADRFHFAGFLKGDDVDKMFLMSDVYVMPSVSEPFGISPLEAMRSNVPVIISKQSGVSEVLHHAIKVDFWDVEAIADSIYALLKYDALSKMFKELGKTEVDNLKWENASAQIKEIYEMAIKQ
jgi:glycogen synthase